MIVHEFINLELGKVKKIIQIFGMGRYVYLCMNGGGLVIIGIPIDPWS